MTGIVAFNSANRVPLPIPPTIELLVIAGGGGASNSDGPSAPGAGGGGGGYRSFTPSPALGVNYALTVGAGGAVLTNGSNSSFIGGAFSYTSAGGGAAGGSGYYGGGAGSAGGSGGGGGAAVTMGSAGAGGAGNTPATSPSQGNNGGNGVTNSSSGGGGGAGAAGSNANGGAGTSSSITGSAVTRAGGGAGHPGSNGSAQTANLGTGGTYQYNSTGLPGQSGVIIIAYPSTFPPITSIGAGLTYTVSTVSRPGYRVYIFTAGSGNISWS
jgi:hypothetical protein